MIERRLLLPLVPWLASVVGLLMLWGWLLGLPVQVQWASVEAQPAPNAPATVPAPVRQPVDLQTYSAVWEVPLFAPGRRADPSQVRGPELPPPDLGGLQLSGVVIAPPLRLALLKQSEGQTLSLRQGESLPDGWLLEQVDEQRIQLTHGAHRQTLEISSPRLPMPTP